VTDPKFQVVAKRAGASVAEVLAVWACLLEAASANADDRGVVSGFDGEAIDCLLGLPDGRADAIRSALADKGLIEPATHRISAWDKRQPKREREDNTAAERKRRQRERDSEPPPDVTPDDPSGGCVTPGHATSHQKTPRGEEIREEHINPLSPFPADAGAPDGAASIRQHSELVESTRAAIETFNASPLTKRNGGMLPNVSPEVGLDTRRKQVRRCLRVAKEIATVALQRPVADAEFWRAYWETVEGDPFHSGRQGGGREHANWLPDFEFLTRPAVMQRLFDRVAA
jgi:hypothetical protein